MSTGKARFVNDHELSSRERGAVGEVVVPPLRSVLCSDTEIFSENFCGDSGRREADNRTGSVFVFPCTAERVHRGGLVDVSGLTDVPTR